MPREHVYWDEVVPVLIIGVAFNLAASYLIGTAKEAISWEPGWFFSLGHLFQDTSGTCFAALALGPWWGAVVGVASSTLNTFWISEQFGDAFAYTCVQVGLALAWGYVGRMSCASATLIAPRFTFLGWKAIGTLVLLILVGAITATVLADQIKLTLLEKAGGDIFQGPTAPYYQAIELYLRNLSGDGDASALAHYLINRFGSRELALGSFDLYANLLDKGLSVLIAIVLLRIVGLVPSAHSLGNRCLPTAFFQRLKVGAHSIVSFATVYGIYLAISALVLRKIHFTHSPVGAAVENWMPQLAVLLLFPFGIGALAYAVFVFRRGRDAYVEVCRRARRDLYNAIRGPNPWSLPGLQKSRFFFIQHNSGYGLIASLVMWPAKTYLLSARGLWLYFLVMAATSLLFVYDRRGFLRVFRNAQQWRADLEKSFVQADATTVPAMMTLFFDVLRGDLARGPGEERRVGNALHQIAVNAAGSGWLSEMRSIIEADHLMLIAAEAVPDIEALDESLAMMKDELGIQLAVILCIAIDKADVLRLRAIRRATGCDIIVLDARDMRDLIADRAQDKDPGRVLVRSRVSSRFARMLQSQETPGNA